MLSDRDLDVQRRADALIRREILPLFRQLGFQRLAPTVSERWDGGRPERPDRYLRLRLIRRPRGMLKEGQFAVSVELSVFHPSLDHPACAVRLDSKGRYSPKPAEVFRSRHDLMLWTDDLEPEWEAQAEHLEIMIEAMARSMSDRLLPEIRKLDDFGYELERMRVYEPMTEDKVRLAVRREHAAVAAGEDLGPREPFVWCTRSRPVCFFDAALCKPADNDDWHDPQVAALLRHSHSLHYAAALAQRHLSREIEAEMRDAALMLENATGVPLVRESEARFLAQFG